MSVYFEGNGKPREATNAEVAELLVRTVVEEREDLLNSPQVQNIEDSAELARYVATSMTDRIFTILDGDNPRCPGFAMMPETLPEEKQEAIDAGGNWIAFREETESCAGVLAELFRHAI